MDQSAMGVCVQVHCSHYVSSRYVLCSTCRGKEEWFAGEDGTGHRIYINKTLGIPYMLDEEIALGETLRESCGRTNPCWEVQ